MGRFGKAQPEIFQSHSNRRFSVRLDSLVYHPFTLSYINVFFSTFSYGPLSVTPKEKKARATRQKEELGKKVVPEEVSYLLRHYLLLQRAMC